MNYITIVNDIIQEKALQSAKLQERINKATEELGKIEAQLTPLRQLAVRLDAERQLEMAMAEMEMTER